MSLVHIPAEEKRRVLEELADVKELFAARNWFPGTSGNLSIRVGEIDGDQLHFAITASGKDKTKRTAEDFLIVDQEGRPAETTGLKPSAETLIHCEIYRLTGCGAVFHVHTVFNNLISEYYGDQGAVPLQGIELIKAFNIWEENAAIAVPVLPNYADISAIAKLVPGVLNEQVPGILLRNHGIYAWGRDTFEAKKHLEAFEFMFETVYRSLLLNK